MDIFMSLNLHFLLWDKTYLGGIIMFMKNIKLRVTINRMLRRYRKYLKEEKALTDKYDKVPNLVEFYEETISELESIKSHLKSKSALV